LKKRVTKILFEMSVQVNDRVVVNKHKATVHYVGDVDGAPSGHVYVGIEWDQGLGKNDGCGPTGRRYFSCTRPGKASSFVPMKMLQNWLDRRCSLEDAIRMKYEKRERNDDQIDDDNDDVDILFVGQGAGAKAVELVCDEKRVAELVAVDVSSSADFQDRCVAFGDGVALAQLVPAARELNVSNNMFSSWQIIFDIASHLLVLQTLVVCRCRPLVDFLRDCTEAASSSSSAAADNADASFRLPMVDMLVLNEVNLCWMDVETLVRGGALPQLKTLQLRRNRLGQFAAAPRVWTTLVELDVSENDIDDWSVLMRACEHMPALRRLTAARNRLGDVFDSSATRGSDAHPLEYLSLDHNMVTSLVGVHELRERFASLQSLRLQFNPLSSRLDPSVVRHCVIALWPKLPVLNASDVTHEERQDSEKFFVKWWLRLGESADHVDERTTRRFDELRERHKISLAADAALSSSSASTSDSVADEFIALTIRAVTPFASKMELRDERVLSSWSVADLKALCAAQFGIEPADQQLSVACTRNSLPERFDDDLASLLSAHALSSSSIVFLDSSKKL
jgi:CAP-Gly domain